MNSIYIIGEIGQNHNGSIEIAKAIIDIAVITPKDDYFNRNLEPINAVKFTKRDLTEELSNELYAQPYPGNNSFGNTYGEHREHLELSYEEHLELFNYAKERGLDVIETLCSIGCLKLLDFFTPDKLKVASRDLTNLPLLEVLAETKIPIIISTGMSGKAELDNALNTISKHHNNISILHCLSQYPAEYNNLNLNTIKFLKNNYPEYKIGYSDHSIGISVPVAAVVLGAEIIEKHITLDRRMKGSDHYSSLGIDGLNRMVRDIRNIEAALGIEDIFISDASLAAKTKLGRSIAANREILKGEVIVQNDIHLLSPGTGIMWNEIDRVIKKTAKVNIKKNDLILESMLSDFN